MSEAKKEQPTVKLTPDFAVGETVIHIGERTEHKILALDLAAKTVRLEGIATLSPLSAIEKKI